MTREEAVKRLKEARSTIQPFRYVDEAIDYAVKALEQEPKTGNWYKKPHEICYTCDKCGTTNASGVKYNFCPHCGAKMKEVEG